MVLQYSRSERRHQRQRLLAKRYRQDARWGVAAVNDAQWRFLNARRRINTGRLCSCMLCRSARKLYGNSSNALTRQELIALDHQKEEV